MIDWLPISQRITLGLDDLLTTRQLQELLQVDRITIYRMLHDGRLQGFKVGGQWRFSRQEIEDWLKEQRVDWEGEEAPARLGGATGSSRALSRTCVQAIQGVCAEALDIGVVTVEADGSPLAEISNSCDFCSLILSSDEGKRRCATAWRSAAGSETYLCHAGLHCVSVPVELGDQLVAITAGCQFTVPPAEGEEPAWRANLPALAVELDLSEKDLRSAVASVHQVSDGQVERIARLLGRVADTFAEIGRERLSLLSRLEYIAEVSKV